MSKRRIRAGCTCIKNKEIYIYVCVPIERRIPGEKNHYILENYSE